VKRKAFTQPHKTDTESVDVTMLGQNVPSTGSSNKCTVSNII